LAPLRDAVNLGAAQLWTPEGGPTPSATDRPDVHLVEYDPLLHGALAGTSLLVLPDGDVVWSSADEESLASSLARHLGPIVGPDRLGVA
jgi:hypothetical protein